MVMTECPEIDLYNVAYQLSLCSSVVTDYFIEPKAIIELQNHLRGNCFLQFPFQL